MLWIGLTGGIGSGKSTAAQAFRDLGVPVVNADELARLVVRPGEPAFLEIIETFGQQVLSPTGELDRQKLAQQVFGDRDRLARLEQIVHPRVRERMLTERQELESEGHRLAIYDVPLLFEKSLEDQFDAVVVVNASVENQIQRTMQRDGLSRDQVLQRLANQIPLSEKARRADYVLNNDGEERELLAQVQKLLKELRDRVKQNLSAKSRLE